MWEVTNRTPYKAARTWGRNQCGIHEWIVVVKGTFDIQPNGHTALSDEQVEPLFLPEYYGVPGESSLRYDADLVSAKPTTDVILNGTAYAPYGRPSTDFGVSMRVGQNAKGLRVRGNRFWKSGILGVTASAIEPVVSLPIVYERAFGGYDQNDPAAKNQRMDSRNPVGCGMVTKQAHRLGQPLPNFEYPNADIENAGPAGFGAIDGHWSPRRELAGTYDSVWEQTRRPLLPADWDARSLQCAPPDQRPDAPLRGGELVELVNLSASGFLKFALPKIYLTFRTRIDLHAKEHRSRLATVILEPDHPRVIMIWLTTLLCPNNGDYLDETLIREKPYI